MDAAPRSVGLTDGNRTTASRSPVRARSVTRDGRPTVTVPAILGIGGTEYYAASASVVHRNPLGSSGGASGLVGNPSPTAESLYARGATSFGPSG